LINGISLSNVDVVKGAKNVDVVMFEVETDDVSAVEVDGFILKGDIVAGSTSGLTVVDRKVVSALRLWKKTNSGWELLDEESGSSLNSEEINFDSFSTVIVPSSSTQLFLVTVDVTDDDANE
jgi:hypothetical protein